MTIILKRITHLSKLKQNVLSIKSSLGKSTKLLLIAKANGYGCGLDNVALLDDDVDYYGVARAGEGVRLRELGVQSPILALSLSTSELTLMRQYDIQPSISSTEEFLAAQAHGITSCHVAVDCGMHRFGIDNIELLQLILRMSKSLRVNGLFSHIYHNSTTVVSTECRLFEQYVQLIRQYNPDCICHIASSGSYHRSDCAYDMVRIGLQAYSGVASVDSGILAVRSVPAGESVGYNGEFVTKRPTKIAVVEGGYADGIDKRLKGLSVMVNNVPCPILGAICMDSFMCDVSGVDCCVGDRVTVIGDIHRASTISGISEYELLTGLKGRYEYASGE